ADREGDDLGGRFGAVEADIDDGGAGYSVERQRLPETTDGRREYPLVRQGAVLDDRDLCRGRYSSIEQARRDVARRVDAHVDRHGGTGLRQRVPVVLGNPVLGSAGQNGQRAILSALGQRQSDRGCTSQGGGDAGDDIDSDAGRRKGCLLLATAAENIGIAALEPY